MKPAKSLAVNPGWALLISDLGIHTWKVLRRPKDSERGAYWSGSCWTTGDFRPYAVRTYTSTTR